MLKLTLVGNVGVGWSCGQVGWSDSDKTQAPHKVSLNSVRSQILLVVKRYVPFHWSIDKPNSEK